MFTCEIITIDFDHMHVSGFKGTVSIYT